MNIKNFNKKVFILSFVFLVILLILSSLSHLPSDDDSLNKGILKDIGKIFYVLCFPTDILFTSIFESGLAIFLAGLLFNLILYSFAIERFYTRFIK